jgi:hypothetical protein
MFNIKAFPLPLKVKVCVCSFYLHFIFKIDGQTDRQTHLEKSVEYSRTALRGRPRCELELQPWLATGRQ